MYTASIVVILFSASWCAALQVNELFSFTGSRSGGASLLRLMNSAMKVARPKNICSSYLFLGVHLSKHTNFVAIRLDPIWATHDSIEFDAAFLHKALVRIELYPFTLLNHGMQVCVMVFILTKNKIITMRLLIHDQFISGS